MSRAIIDTTAANIALALAELRSAVMQSLNDHAQSGIELTLAHTEEIVTGMESLVSTLAARLQEAKDAITARAQQIGESIKTAAVDHVVNLLMSGGLSLAEITSRIGAVGLPTVAVPAPAPTAASMADPVVTADSVGTVEAAAQGEAAPAAAAAAVAAPTAESVLGYKNPVKYAHAGKVWSGRGPMPKWLKALLDSGAQLCDFLVNKPLARVAVAVAAAAAPVAQAEPVVAAPAAQVEQVAAAEPAQEPAASQAGELTPSMAASVAAADAWPEAELPVAGGPASDVASFSLEEEEGGEEAAPAAETAAVIAEAAPAAEDDDIGAPVEFNPAAFDDVDAAALEAVPGDDTEAFSSGDDIGDAVANGTASLAAQHDAGDDMDAIKDMLAELSGPGVAIRAGLRV